MTKLNFQIQEYSCDSNPNKRIGSALAFNNLYRSLREEESVIVKYWLNLLQVFCTNFLITEKMESDFEHVSSSIDHITRVLTERSDLFNKTEPKRIKPNQFGEGNLIGAITWIVKQCGSRQENYRKKCMELFINLSPSVDNFESRKTFLRQILTLDEILEVCEGKLDENGIAGHPNLNHLRTSKISPYVCVRLFLEDLLSALDNYCWLVENDLLMDGKTLFKKSTIFEVVIYYLKTICWASVFDIINLHNSNAFEGSIDSSDACAGLIEIQKINSNKCKVLVKIIDLLLVLLKDHLKCISDKLWLSDSGFISAIVHLIFDPEVLGFDLKNPDIVIGIPKLLENLLMHLKKFAPKEFAEKLYVEIGKQLFTKLKNTTDSARELLSAEDITMNQLNTVKGIELICRNLKYSTFSG